MRAVSAPDSSRSETITVAPSRAKANAVARPMPRAPPTTSVMRSANSAMRPPIRLQLDEYSLLLGVHLDRSLRVLAADARLLVAAERRGQVLHRVAVDPDLAGLQRARHAQRAIQVPRPDGGAETVDRIVTLKYCVLLVLEGNQRSDRPEDFLARDAHGVLHAGEYRRLDVVARASHGAAAEFRHGALLAAEVHIGGHALELLAESERSHLGFGVERVAD